LRSEDLPSPNDKAAIWAFAMSFNSYDQYGSLESAAVAARERRRSSVAELRNELFMAARASRHGDSEVYVQRYEELLPLFRRLLSV